MFTKTSLAVLAALGCAASVHAAPAGTSSAPALTSVTVSVADLDLADRAGAKVALQRIHAAAKTVCGGEPDVREIERMALYEACIRTGANRAVAALGSPIVTALNDQNAAMVVANRR
jgi:UrcA family protein